MFKPPLLRFPAGNAGFIPNPEIGLEILPITRSAVDFPSGLVIASARELTLFFRVSPSCNRRYPLIVWTWPWFPVGICEDEFLNPFAGIHLTGIQVAFGVDGDRIDPMKVAGHPPVVSDRSSQCARLPV